MEGARAPLFERLADPDADSAEEKRIRVLDRQALRESVRRSLVALLNTRHAPGAWGGDAGGTVLDYGLPDFSSLSPASESDRRRVAEAMAGQISRHEPRLSQVRVIVRPVKANPSGLTGEILAYLCVGSVNEPVSFALALGGTGLLTSGEEPAAVTVE